MSGSGFVHANRFARLAEDVNTTVCSIGVDGHSVNVENGCLNKTHVAAKKCKRIIEKGKNTFTICMDNQNPVQRCHNTVITPIISNRIFSDPLYQ